jgi:hypothetical protein
VQRDAVSGAVKQQEMLEQDKLRREKEEVERQNALLQAPKFSKVSVRGFMR